MGAYFVLYPHSRILTLIPIIIFIQIIEIPAIFFLAFWFIMQLFSGVGSLAGAEPRGRRRVLGPRRRLRRPASLLVWPFRRRERLRARLVAPIVGAPMPPVVVFYISGHGFGHASRDIEVINALLDRRPEVRVIVRTAAKRWLFDLTVRHPSTFERLRVRHGRRADRQPPPRRGGDDSAGGGVLSRPRREGRPRKRRSCVRSRRRARGGRFAPAGVRGRGMRPACRRSRSATSPGTGSTRRTRTELAQAPGLLALVRDAYRRAELVLRLPDVGRLRDGARSIAHRRPAARRPPVAPRPAPTFARRSGSRRKSASSCCRSVASA